MLAELRSRVRELELSGDLEFDARSLLLANYHLVNMDILDLDLASRIEALVSARLGTLTAEDIVTLFVSHARLSWKTQYKLKEAAVTRSQHVKRRMQTRAMTKDFWSDLLPAVSLRLHEFSLGQLSQLLRAAAKPHANKRSLLRILIGFFLEATKLLEQLPFKHADFRKHYEELQEVSAELFKSELMRETAEEALRELMERKKALQAAEIE